MSVTSGVPENVKATFGRVVTTLAGETTRTSDAHVTLDPVTSRVSVDPLVASSASTVELRPVAVDSSVRVVFGELPPTAVRTPYAQTWSWSLLGRELFSLTIRGETTTHFAPAGSSLASSADYRVDASVPPAALSTSDVTVALVPGIPSREYAAQPQEPSGSSARAESGGPTPARRSARSPRTRR